MLTEHHHEHERVDEGLAEVRHEHRPARTMQRGEAARKLSHMTIGPPALILRCAHATHDAHPLGAIPDALRDEALTLANLHLRSRVEVANNRRASRVHAGMRTDYTAIAVLGCEVTGKLYQQVEVPGCACSAGKEGKFCPSCGKSTAPILEEVARPFYDQDKRRIGTLSVKFSTDYERAFAGVVVDSDARAKSAGLFPLREGDILGTIQRIRSTLEPIGLWDPSLFGLWSVMHVSY